MVLVCGQNEHAEWPLSSSSLQCGRWGEALRHQQDPLRLRLRRAVQPVQLTKRTRTSLPAHVFGPAQRLSECDASVPGLRPAETVRTRPRPRGRKKKARRELETPVLGLHDSQRRLPRSDLKREEKDTNEAWNISVTLPEHEPEASLNVDFFLLLFRGSTESSGNCWTLPQQRTSEAFS